MVPAVDTTVFRSPPQHRNGGDLVDFHHLAQDRGALRDRRAGGDDVVDEEETRPAGR
jgi:hypothetical protein